MDILKHSLSLLFSLFVPSALAFTLTSPDFKDMDSIPQQFTCKGADIQPTLNWTGAPNKTQSFVLTMLDPDAPAGTFIHWLVYNIPATIHSLEKNHRVGILGLNTMNQAKYMGPCPPSGRHHYHFTLYALDTSLTLKDAASLSEINEAMKSHILGEAKLTGMFP